MKKLLFVLIAALGFSTVSYAQMTEKELKKAVKAAQRVVKDARNEEERDDGNKNKAKQMIDQSMKNDLVKDWDQTWSTAALIYMNRYNDENVKVYQKKGDTIKMYNYMMQWFDYALRADSLQQIPDAKGKTSNEARKYHADKIGNNVSNLINAGIFYFNHRSDYKTAYECFDKFFTLVETPMIKEQIKDIEFFKDLSQFAYFPTLAGYQLQDWDKLLKYADLARSNEEYGETSTQFVCEAYGNMKDSVAWLKTLKEGMLAYPESDYFYSKLLTYYNDKDDMDALSAFVEEMIERDPEKAYNYYVVGVIALQAGDLEKAKKNYEIAIEKDPTMSDAYNNLGICITKEAQAFMESKQNLNYKSAEYKKALEQEKEYYKQAEPYFLKVKELEPNETKKWAIPLYSIYYITNNSKELSKIEAILKAEGLL